MRNRDLATNTGLDFAWLCLTWKLWLSEVTLDLAEAPFIGVLAPGVKVGQTNPVSLAT